MVDARATPGLWVHRSNRTERLLDELVECVAIPASSNPLRSECIVVQGRGMERWLSMELSRVLGIWAQPDFPFPRQIIERCLDAVLGGGESGESPFQAETLMWSIADLLPRFAADPVFAPVASYLRDDHDGQRTLQLAERIAGTFDAYLVHRPQMITAWERGSQAAEPGGGPERDAAWQSTLWRALVERHGEGHLARRLTEFEVVLRSEPESGLLPPRISVFGLSSLPPLFIDAFQIMSRWVEVHLFVLSPSREFWADLRSEKEQWRDLLRAGNAVGPSDEVLRALEGHSLLAAFGRVGRDFQQILEAHTDYLEPDRDLYVDPCEAAQPTGLLHRLQSDMLSLRQRDVRAATGESSAEPNDGSLRVHACHSPMREIEVLYDQLIDLFERQPDLQPQDVVVMSPDIEHYAPFIEAVFGRVSGQREAPRIPYRIADRSVIVTQEVVATFLRLLEVLTGRFPMSSVLDLLAAPCVRERYDLAAEDLARVRGWVEGAGVRWGLDADQRVREGLPNSDAFTWRFGLDRLLLGVAMGAGPSATFQGCLAEGGLEGADARAVGRLAEFIDDLAWAAKRLAGPRRPGDWSEVLASTLERVIVRNDDNAHHHQALRAAFEKFAEGADAADFEGRLGLAAVREQLLRNLRASTPSHGFLSGGVTFCQMVPMRSIPFEVVCVVGLDDDAFPRIRRPLGFDLMARHPHVGDRSPRDDDRALFLEGILSARSVLLLSYIGLGVRDNAEKPPSVVVSELLDEVGVVRGTEPDRFVLRHPLQPFSSRYFSGEDERLFSHGTDALAGARALAGPGTPPQPFVSPGAALIDSADSSDPLALGELTRFFRKSSRHFLRDGIGVRVEQTEEPERDREPSRLAPLTRWQLGDALLSRARAGEDLEALYEYFAARGQLPPGDLGRLVYRDVLAEVTDIERREAVLHADETPRVVDIDLEVGGTRLVGRVDGVISRGRVVSGYGKLGSLSELDTWIQHLALSAAAGNDARPVTWLLGRAGGSDTPVVHFQAVADPMALLAELIELHRSGQRAPLAFFPKSARKYADKRRGEDSDEREAIASKDAYLEFRGDDGGGGERSEDASIRLLFSDHDPLAPGDSNDSDNATALGFRQIAGRVFGPLLDHRESGA